MTSGQIDLARVLNSLGTDALHKRPPVETWTPSVVSQIDIEIKRDGSWWHEGTKIQRFELVKLFASILIHQDGDYFLVTPAEKCQVRVADVPFIIDAVVAEFGFAAEGVQPAPLASIKCITNLGEEVMLGKQHPLQLKTGADGVPVPYVLVRNGMQARVGRNPYYELVSLSSIESSADGAHDVAVLRLPDVEFTLGVI